jgi:hypothetical protein
VRLIIRNKFKVVEFQPNKLAMKFDITMLNMLIGYLFKNSSQVTRKALNNMKKLFDLIDNKVYDGNEQLENRFYFINKSLEARIVRGFENENMIINYCRPDNDNKEIKSFNVFSSNLLSY